jgi:hypothetical protein
MPYRPAVACSSDDGGACCRGTLHLAFDADDLEIEADEQDDEDP